MKIQPGRLPRKLVLLGIMTAGLWGCGGSSDTNSGTGGSGHGGSTSATSTGGTLSTGGTVASGGSLATGGIPSTGGTVATSTGGTGDGGNKGSGGATGGSGGPDSGTGGAKASGGSTGGGTSGTDAGVSTGGRTGGAGTQGDGGAATGGKTGTGGSTGSGGSSGSCQKGQVKPNEVVFMGESFYAIDPQYIQKRIEADAQAAGALAAGAKYRNLAASGQPMSYIAGTEWTNATKDGATVKVVIMDGGGIDCLTSSSCPTCASQFTTLLGKMATAGVQHVIYTRYPEPGAPPGSNASLKKCLDTVMPTMQPVCEGATGPKCHWVDLRPVFVAGDTTDGLHPTQSGGNHVGDLIWAEMVKDCIAQ